MKQATSGRLFRYAPKKLTAVAGRLDGMDHPRVTTPTPTLHVPSRRRISRQENAQVALGSSGALRDMRLAALQRAFPSGSEESNRIDAIDGHNKHAPLLGRPAAPRDYAQHLDTTSLDGVGGLGIVPATRGRVHRGRWLAYFAALDFDHDTLEAVRAFLATLPAELRALVSSGTTGRGAHVFFLFTTPVRLELVHAFLVELREQAVRVGLHEPEIRPSNESGAGQRIFLPYRAAFADGLGANPLIDPRTGSAIFLERLVADRTFFTSASCVRARGHKRVRAAAYPPPAPAAPRFKAEGSAQERFLIEIDRLRPEWFRGRRQNLTLALTAYAIKRLARDPDEVWSAIETLELASDRPEPKLRRSAFESTLNRIRAGQRVAYIDFYEGVGIMPPGSSPVMPAVHARIDALQRWIVQPGWGKPRTRGAERRVMIAILAAAREFGLETRDGFCVSISERALAEAAGMYRPSARDPLKRLQQRGLLNPRRRTESLPTLWHVCIPAGERSTHSLLREVDRGQQEWEFCAHPTFQYGLLAQADLEIGQALLNALGSMQKRDLVAATGRSRKTISTSTARLLRHGIVCKDDDQTHRLADDWRDRLDETARRLGARARIDAIRDRHEQERTAYHVHLVSVGSSTPELSIEARRTQSSGKTPTDRKCTVQP